MQSLSQVEFIGSFSGSISSPLFRFTFMFVMLVVAVAGGGGWEGAVVGCNWRKWTYRHFALNFCPGSYEVQARLYFGRDCTFQQFCPLHLYKER